MGAGGRAATFARTCGGTTVAPCKSGCPSRLQNFAPGRLRYPHLGQMTSFPAAVDGTTMVALGEMAGICTVAGTGAAL